MKRIIFAKISNSLSASLKEKPEIILFTSSLFFSKNPATSSEEIFEVLIRRMRTPPEPIPN